MGNRIEALKHLLISVGVAAGVTAVDTVPKDWPWESTEGIIAAVCAFLGLRLHAYMSKEGN